MTPRAGGLFYGASIEQRAAPVASRDQTIASLRGGWRGQRANGDRITLSLGLRHVETPRANARGATASLQLSYAPAKPLGPIAWSAGLGLGYSEYPDFTMGIFAVPGGRQEDDGLCPDRPLGTQGQLCGVHTADHPARAGNPLECVELFTARTVGEHRHKVAVLRGFPDRRNALGSGGNKGANMPLRYLHTMVRVLDLEASMAFYALLGLREKRRIDNAEGRFTLVFMAPPGQEETPIELTYNWDGDPGLPADSRHFGHLAFGVDDIYETCAHLRPMVSPSTARRATAAWPSCAAPTISRSSCCKTARRKNPPNPGPA